MAVFSSLWRAVSHAPLPRTSSALWCQHARRVATTASAEASGAGRVALVQGASRGLGLEFTRQLLLRPQQRCVLFVADQKLS